MSGPAPVAPDVTGTRPRPHGTARSPQRAIDALARVRVVGLRRWTALPPWGQALLVFAVSRLYVFAVLERTARFQSASLWTDASPGYLGFVDLWDGDWYRRIAETGYPTTVPLGPDGLAQQNELAFYPLYPLLVRGVMTVTGMGWALAATLTALLLGAAAMVVLRSLLAGVVGSTLALWGVVLVTCFPSAPVLQLAYTESLALLLLVSVLWCLQRHRYVLAVPLVLLIGVSRPIAAPVAVVVLVHLGRRVAALRTGAPEPRGRLRPRDAVAGVTLLGACGVAVLEWPLITWALTGDAHAYTNTQAAWRVGHVLTPLRPWLTISRYLLGYWVGPALLVLLIVGFLLWTLGPRSRVIAGDLRVWCVAYAGYLLLVLDPFTSLFRYLLLLFPLGVLLASAAPSKAYRWSLTCAFLAGQIVWVVWLWRFTPPTDWPP